MDDNRPPIFRLMNEIGIIAQLSSALMNRTLPDGLHVSHFGVLSHFMRLGDGKTPLALARAFQVSKGTMTHTLNTLAKRGFVRFEAHESDGRSKLVFITDEGREFFGKAIADLMPTMGKFQQLIDMDQVLEILPTLEHLRKVLDENRDI